MIGYLVASLWSVGETKNALETALRYYREVGWGEVPLFFYKSPASSDEDSSWFRALPEPNSSGWMLIFPSSMTIESFLGKISDLVDEYPEAESILMKLEEITNEEEF